MISPDELGPIPYFQHPEAQQYAAELLERYPYPETYSDIAKIALSCSHPAVEAQPEYALVRLQHQERIEIRVAEIRLGHN